MCTRQSPVWGLLSTPPRQLQRISSPANETSTTNKTVKKCVTQPPARWVNLRIEARDCLELLVRARILKTFSVHIFQVTRHLRSGVHHFAALEHSRLHRVSFYKFPCAGYETQIFAWCTECPRAVKCTWTWWHWKPVHNPYQAPSRIKSSKIKKKNLRINRGSGSPRAGDESFNPCDMTLLRRHCQK